MLETKKIKVPAGGVKILNNSGSFFGCPKASAEFRIGIDDDTPSRFFAGLSFAMPKDGTGKQTIFKSLTIENLNAFEIEIEIDIGKGVIDDRRVFITGNVSSEHVLGSNLLNGSSSVEVSAELVAGNLNRKSISIQPLGGEIYVGGAGVSVSNGIKVLDGQVWTTDKTTAAIHAVASAPTDVRYWEEY